MDLQRLLERLDRARDAVIRAALRCSSAGELLELAQERGIELSASEAEELLPLLQRPAEELSELELDAVAGGMGVLKCPECYSSSLTPLGKKGPYTVYECSNCHKKFIR